MIHTFRLPDHDELKSRLLEYMDASDHESIIEGPDRISKSDNYIPDTPENKPYFGWFAQEVMEEICSYYAIQAMRTSHVWYQQYYRGDQHAWHVHPQTSISSVYFIELPDSKFSTEFFDVETRRTLQYDIQEGDIITFAGHIPHRSPPLLSDERKTIIGANFIFDRVNTKLFDNE